MWLLITAGFDIVVPFYLFFVFIVDLLIAQVRHKALSLGEVLDGDRMAESLYKIHFRENTERQTLCQLTLSEKEVLFTYLSMFTFVSAIIPHVI